MAFFSPLGALSAGLGGFMEGRRQADEDAELAAQRRGNDLLGQALKGWDLSGMAGLSSMPQMPVAQPVSGIGGPQAPFPGQASVPAAGPQPPGPAVGGGGPPVPVSGGAGGPVIPPSPAQRFAGASDDQVASAYAALQAGQGQPIGGYRPPPPPARPAPPQAPPPQAQAGPPPQTMQQRPQAQPQSGPPQFDLRTLISRINQVAPNATPKEFAYALKAGLPLLTEEGKRDMAALRQEVAAGNLSLREAMLKLQEARFSRQGDVQDEKKAAIEKIGDAIIAGDQPPTMTGLYRDRLALQAYLADKKYSLSKAQQEWNVAQKQIGSLNSQRMIQFAGTAKSVVNTLDEVKQLSEEMEMSGIPLLNKAELIALSQTQGNTPAGQLAGRYIAAVNTLKSEFANLENGGYAPTEEVWKLANKQIDENYGVKQLGARLDEIRRLVSFRIKAIPNLDTLGGASANRYTGQPGQSLVPPPPGGGGQQQIPARVKQNGHTYERQQDGSYKAID